MPCPDESVIVDFVRGALSAEAAHAFDLHLDSCSNCRLLVSELVRTLLTHDQNQEAGSSPTAQAPDFLLLLGRGTAIGRYVILDRLGAGGMGVVYTAYDPELNRKVAIKFPRTKTPSSGSDSEQGERLMREAQAMARLSHPNVVAIYDVGKYYGHVFIAMEYVEGLNLYQWLKQSPRAWREVVKVFGASGHGLAAAHEAGLIHRDFKPDNVLISSDGRILVTDFGMARPASEFDLGDQAAALPASSTPGFVGSRLALETPLTQTGELLGTPAYMAPEQLQRQPADARSDQYSFCVALFEGLYGQRPFRGQNLEELREQILTGEIETPAPIHKIPVPAWLHKLLWRGLSKDPQQRYVSMNDLLRELSQDPSQRRRRWLKAVLVLVMVGAMTWILATMSAKQQSLCQGAQKKLDGIWDAGRKAQMQQAFMAIDVPYAADTWRSLEQSLDQYAKDWAAAHTEACEATSLRGEQSEELLDLRMQCLTQVLSELRALCDLLLQPDAKLVENALEAAQSLSPIEPCANADSLLNRVKLPSDPTARKEVEKIWEALAEVKALWGAGKPKPAMEKIKKLVPQAQGLGYRPLESESLYWLGMLQYAVWDYKMAEQTLLQSATVAIESRDHTLVVRALLQLALDVGYMQSRIEESLRWTQLAAAHIKAGANLGFLQWELELVLARLHLKNASYDLAISQFHKALELIQNVRSPESQEVASLLSQLGAAYQQQGKYQQALTFQQRALEIQRKTLGPDHLNVAETLNRIGIVHRDLGKFEDALVDLSLAMEIMQRNFGSEHPAAAAMLNNIGNVYNNLSQPHKALDYYQRSLTIKENIKGPNDTTLTSSLMNMAMIHLKLGQYAKGLEYSQRAYQIFETAFGSDSPHLAGVLNVMSELHLRQGQASKALSLVERALLIQNKKSSGNICELGISRFLLGWAMWDARKDRAHARQWVVQAVETCAWQSFEEKGDLAKINRWLAQHPL